VCLIKYVEFVSEESLDVPGFTVPFSLSFNPQSVQTSTKKRNIYVRKLLTTCP